ncbi:2241_t:CDS:2, partial [Racocetra persica]
RSTRNSETRELTEGNKMKQQKTILSRKRQNDGVMCLKSDDLVKPFYDRGIVELVNFLWDFERPWMRKMTKAYNTWYSLKKAMIKEVVEIEEKINKVWNIRQRDDKSILAYTYHYESLVVPVKAIIKNYEEMYWYTFG